MGGLVEWVDLLWVGSWLLHYIQVMKQNILKWRRGTPPRILRDLFLVFQNLLCNCEVIFRKRFTKLCVTYGDTTPLRTSSPGPSVLQVHVGVDTVCVLLVQRTWIREVASSARLLVFFPVKTPASLQGEGEDLGRGVPIIHPPWQVGVVSVPFKATSSELNRCPKGHHH